MVFVAARLSWCDSPRVDGLLRTVTVANNEDLLQAIRSAKPGDDIVVLPGEYQGGIGATLVGEAEHPIRIRAHLSDIPPIIKGGFEGLHLASCHHLILQDLIFEGAAENGINIDDGGRIGSPATHIQLIRVVIREAGRQGNQDGLKMSGVDHFLLQECRFEGCGAEGQQVDLVGCHDGKVINCVFDGHDRAPLGFQAKGGSSDIIIENCRFFGIVERGLQIGGVTDKDLFRPRFDGFEARDVVVDTCKFEGGASAVSLVNCTDALISNCSFYRQNEWVFRVLQESRGPEYPPCQKGRFLNNTIVWHDTELSAFVRTSPEIATHTFEMIGNSWYCEDFAARSQPRGILFSVSNERYSLPLSSTESTLPTHQDLASRLLLVATSALAPVLALCCLFFIFLRRDQLPIPTEEAFSAPPYRLILIGLSLLYVTSALYPFLPVFMTHESFSSQTIIPEWRQSVEREMGRASSAFMASLLGITAALAFRSKTGRTSPVRNWLACTLLFAVAFSLIEFLQTQIPYRLRAGTSQDAFELTAAASLGVLLSMAFQNLTGSTSVQSDRNLRTLTHPVVGFIAIYAIAASLIAHPVYEPAFDSRSLHYKWQSGGFSWQSTPASIQDWLPLADAALIWLPIGCAISLTAVSASSGQVSLRRTLFLAFFMPFSCHLLLAGSRTVEFRPEITLAAVTACLAGATLAHWWYRPIFTWAATLENSRPNPVSPAPAVPQIRTRGAIHRPLSPLPLSRTYFWLGTSTLLLAIYGSLLPLHYTSLSFDKAIDRFQGTPYLTLSIYRRADWVANILLFVPMSFAFAASALSSQRSRLFSVLVALSVVPLGVAASIGLEFLQLWFPPRTVSQNDIFAESLGTVLGVATAFLFIRPVNRWLRAAVSVSSTEQTIDRLLTVYALGLIAYSFMPLDFVTSIDELRVKYESQRLTWTGSPEIGTLAAIGKSLLLLGATIPFGYLLGGPFLPIANNSLRLLVTISLAASLEAIQIPIFTKSTSLMDAVSFAIGSAIGFGLRRRFAPRFVDLWSVRRSSLRGTTSLLLAIAYSALLIAIVVWPGRFVTLSEALPAIRSFFTPPFSSLYWSSEYHALGVVLRSLATTVPLGFLLADWLAAGSETGIQRKRTLAAIFIGSVSALLELVQAFVPHAQVDSTNSLLYLLGGFAGMSLRQALTPSNTETRRPAFARVTGQFALQASGLLLLLPLAFHLLGHSAPNIRATDSGETHLANSRNAYDHDDQSFRGPIRAEVMHLPEFPEDQAIWGSIGKDDLGSIWLGVSASTGNRPSARLTRLDPSTSRGRVIASTADLLDRLHEPFAQQAKIHSRIVPANDGYLYFSSMDEKGEASDGTRLPDWGSHAWRVSPRTEAIEHLFSAPEGLIAADSSGETIFFLGLFNHVLYRFDTRTRSKSSVAVGSIGGHISRNFFSDDRGHVYVPRLRWTNPLKPSPPNPSSRDMDVAVTLVEFDNGLTEVQEFPLNHYLTESYWENHGITAVAKLPDGRRAFLTSAGHLYQLVPGHDSTATICEDMGYWHPAGEVYSPSLFSLDGGRTLAGMVLRDKSIDWVTRHQDEAASRVFSVTLPDGLTTDGLLLYGSMTRDDEGACYVVGRRWGTPLVLRLLPQITSEHAEKIAVR